ncbi:UNVERIFIED_CONTAM: hypothetical protein FKN15_028343 [Acipenser sinensis]
MDLIGIIAMSDQKLPTQLLVGPAVREDAATKGNLGFIHAFVAAISVIIVSELGDKTFFIAAIMAMRYNRLTVLAGAMLALGVMTCLSVLFGYATTIIPRIYTYYVSTALFAIFGIRMLREGFKMSPDEGQEELEEVQAEIKKKDEEKLPTQLLVGPAVREDAATKGNLGFIHAFVAAISVIIVSELGDKTFFIAAIMAMRYNRLTVLAGAMLALGVMTCLSVLFGYATTIIPRIYTYYVSTALFAIFGIRMLREGFKMSPDEGQEELEEVQAEIKKKDEEDPFGVAVGGTLGHCLCTGLAVIGGRMIAQKISVRTVTIIGGIVFLAFAFSALFIKPDAGF